MIWDTRCISIQAEKRQKFLTAETAPRLSKLGKEMLCIREKY